MSTSTEGTSAKTKIFNDSIHGHIELHPACVAIIDTPQFQRLRYIKQLGLSYYVYPGACHKRFEHSLGVCHLAGEFVRHLQQNQRDLGITDIDILCVEIAGLCHDIGHGPFSHLFDKIFPEKKSEHEDRSLFMLDHMIEENSLMAELEKYNLNETDILFIKELIHHPKSSSSSKETWALKGRGPDKAFLYEIVANQRTGVDVDKWDYFARDCHHLGIKNNFDHLRIIKFARVIEVDGIKQICIRDKEQFDLHNMFFTRYSLHKRAYQHRVTCGLELMVARALSKANRYMLFKGKDGHPYPMSDTMDDPKAFEQLTDNILFKILESESQEQDMLDAKEIIQRLGKRDLYRCVFESKSIEAKKLENENEKSIQKEILKKAKSLGADEITEEDLAIKIVQLDFGKKEEDPTEKIKVFSKLAPNKALPFNEDGAIGILKPSRFKEVLVRVYSCKKDWEGVLENAAEQWSGEFQSSHPGTNPQSSSTSDVR